MSANKGLVPRVGVGALCSPLEVGADRAPGAAADMAKRLEEAGCETVAVGVLDTPARAAQAGRTLAEEHVDAVVLVPASWFEDYLVLDLLEECAQPLLFRPLPGIETGALCGTQQATCYLHELGSPYASVFGEADDSGCLARSLAYLRAAALRTRLRRCRIGLAGHHLNGMTHTAPNEFMLKKIVGPRVVFLDLPTLLSRAAEMPENEARGRWQALKEQAGTCDVSEADGLDSMRVYAALREEVGKHDLNAVTVGCYPHLMGRVCLAASLLADEGIPMACEGDVHGAVGMFMLTLLTGEPVHHTDWLDPVDEFSVVFTHCGSGSFSLAEKPSEIRLGSVRLMGQGVCALFPARPGPVTLVSLTACAGGYQCAWLEGEAESTDMVFPGNPVRVRFETSAADLIEWIHDRGIGHHWMIGYGHMGVELRAWADIVGEGLRLVGR